MRRYSQGYKVPLVYENSVNNRPKKKIREFYLNQTEDYNPGNRLSESSESCSFC